MKVFCLACILCVVISHRAPTVPTKWYLGTFDPYHGGRGLCYQLELCYFVLHEGGAHLMSKNGADYKSFSK